MSIPTIIYIVIFVVVIGLFAYEITKGLKSNEVIYFKNKRRSK
jgi:hypothetical protein